MEPEKFLNLLPQADEYYPGGITTRSFPPVVVGDRVVVLREYRRTGQQGRLLWYGVFKENGKRRVAYALQVLD